MSQDNVRWDKLHWNDCPSIRPSALTVILIVMIDNSGVMISGHTHDQVSVAHTDILVTL